MLKFRVVGQRLIWENPDEVIVADTKKYLECYFEFDGDAWRGYKLIDAYFKKGRDNPIRMVLSANRIWREDELCLSAGEWSLYLCATEYATRTNADGSTESIVDRQITSSVVTIKVLASGQMTNAENSFESPEIADQYIARMAVFENARVSAENARVSAENARVSAENARVSAENARADAESARVSAEGLRVSAEAKRVSAEDARVNAENAREKEMRELIEDVVAATGCKVFDIDMSQYGFGDSEVGETYYFDSGIGIPNVRLGDFVFDTVAGYIHKCVRKAEADAIVGDGFLCVAALGGSSGGGGFRKIGFTSDCDFVATAEDGLTAFRNALDAATDGETFFVMSGVYKGADTLTIAKNLNFIGVGMPTIEFPIYIYGEGEYDVGGSSIITPIVTYSTNWSGIAFENQVTAFFTQNYASPLAFSSVNSVYCSFNGIGNQFMGSHFKSSFMFDFEEDYYRVTLGGEFDYLGSTFENCDLIFKMSFNGLFSAKKCNMFFNMKNPAYTGESSYIFEHCNIYNYGNYVVNNGQYSSNFIVSNCNIFGSTFFSEATASGNYLISGTAL